MLKVGGKVGKALGNYLEQVEKIIADVLGFSLTQARKGAEAFTEMLNKITALFSDGSEALVKLVRKFFATIRELAEKHGLKKAQDAAVISSKRWSEFITDPILRNRLSKIPDLQLLDLDGQFHIRYRDTVLFSGTQAEVSTEITRILTYRDRTKLTAGDMTDGVKKYLDEMVALIEKRKALRLKWLNKISKSFYSHLDGEWKWKQKKKQKIQRGIGGHNPNALGDTIRIREGFETIPPNPLPDQPFSALIDVRVNNEWIPKDELSSFFPENWSMERIEEEIAFVYENTVAKGVGIEKSTKNGKVSYRGFSTNGFQIKIEVLDGQIINAYPKI